MSITYLRNHKTQLIFAILITFACCSHKSNALKILGLFPFNGKSHFVICESLIKGLASRGHQIDVYSHFPLKKPIPNYTDFSLAGTLPDAVNNISYNIFKKIEKLNMEFMIREGGRELCNLMNEPVFRKLFQRLKKSQPYDMIIVELFISDCYIAWGRYLNIPIIGVMSSAVLDWYHEALGNPYNTAVDPLLWMEYFFPMNFWDRLSNTLMYRVINAQHKYYAASQNEYVEKFFGPGYPEASELIKDIDLLLVNTHYSIDGVRAFTPNIVPIAGLHLIDDNTKLPREVQKWLDESTTGCIYFSFGSMVRLETFPKYIIDIFYESFKKIAPVRILMKIAKSEDLPSGLPPNVMVQPWLPQLQVLKHKNIKAFISHGGMMGTQESLYAGVPVIGIPLFADQHVNINSQVKRKVATLVNLQDINSNTLIAAIEEILYNPIYKENANSFAKKFFDRPMNPMDTAVFWIEYIARHGKGALRPPIVDMSWWQTKLIDVYGFIFVIVIAFCYTVKIVIRKLIYSCRFSFGNKKKKQ